ncbi:hypothetical protein PLESTF_000100500 [Pleodorina starrii]|nr:hypothetical protein PLESTM_001266400 [Pleodorina starrii]GLC63935.1 hypothetical protein PLESTF_000100500 [Pleodorina starrii]
MDFDVDALFSNQQFTKLLGEVVKKQVTSLALSQIRSICNQLLFVVEDTFTPSSSRGFYLAPSPLQALVKAWPGSLNRLEAFAQRYPALGGSVDGFSANCRQLRHDRNQEQHPPGPEDVLQEIRLLREEIDLPSLCQRQPFLYGLFVSADDFVYEFLAGPRLVKLAQVALQECKNRLSNHPERSWTWQKPDSEKADRIRQFIDTILHAVPDLAEDVPHFAASADDVAEQAVQLRPTKLQYDPLELQRRVTLCKELGMFSASVQASYPFAYKVVSHLDVLLSSVPNKALP